MIPSTGVENLKSFELKKIISVMNDSVRTSRIWDIQVENCVVM